MTTSVDNRDNKNHNIHVHAGMAQVAEEKRIVQSHLAKDVYVPSSFDEAAILGIVDGKEKELYPLLPEPTTAFSGLGDKRDSAQDYAMTSTIAIIGEVLILLAKTNSNFWSTMWKQSSESMMAQIQMAPVIADAVESAYKEQSEATKTNASQAMTTAIINFGAFAGTAVMGTMMTMKMPKEGLEEAAVGAKEEALEGAAGAATPSDAELLGEEGAAGAPRPSAEALGNQQQLANSTPKLNWKSPVQAAKRFFKNHGGAFSRGSNTVAKWLQNSGQAATIVGMASQGSEAVNTNINQGIVANHQAAEGQQQALSKQGEQVAQFFGQSFGRSEDVRQGAQQAIDYAMNILKSAADGMTQAVASMFRG